MRIIASVGFSILGAWAILEAHIARPVDCSLHASSPGEMFRLVSFSSAGAVSENIFGL